MVAGDATKCPEGILQSLGKRDIALASQNNMGVLEATIGQPEVIQAMVQRLTGNGHAKFAHGREVRQSHLAWLMCLPEDHLMLWAVLSIPGPHPPLQRAPDAGAQIGMSPQQLFQNRDRTDARRRL